MNNPIISYIIPAKNAESTIINAIDSINSSFSSKYDFEIIIVVHSKDDPTYKVVNELKQNNIHLFESSGNGVARSRNIGLKEAKGKYIAFLDADDTLYFNGKDFYKDMVSNSHSCYFGQPFTSERNKTMDERLIGGHNELDGFFSQSLLVSALWEYYISNDFIRKYNIVFNDNLLRDEDGPFCTDVITRTSDLYITGKYFINYNDSENSLSKTYTLSHFLSLVDSYSYIYKSLVSQHFDKSLVRWANNFVDIFMYLVATKANAKDKRKIATSIKNSDCKQYFKLSDRKKPRFLYRVFGLRFGWFLIRLLRGKQ